MERFRLLLGHLSWIEHQFLSFIKDSRKTGTLWGMMRGVGRVRQLIHQSWLAKGLGLLCWGFKGVHEEIRVSGISTSTMHQSITPDFSQTIWARWTSIQFITLPIVILFSLWLLVIPEAQRLSLWDNWDERGCDKGHWHAHTSGLTWGLPEVFGMVNKCIAAGGDYFEGV